MNIWRLLGIGFIGTLTRGNNTNDTTPPTSYEDAPFLSPSSDTDIKLTASVLHHQAEHFFNTQQYSKAIEAYSHTISLRETSNPNDYHNRGVAYFKTQNYSAAENDLLTAIHIDSSNANTHHWLGVVYVQQNPYAFWARLVTSSLVSLLGPYIYQQITYQHSQQQQNDNQLFTIAPIVMENEDTLPHIHTFIKQDKEIAKAFITALFAKQELDFDEIAATVKKHTSNTEITRLIPQLKEEAEYMHEMATGLKQWKKLEAKTIKEIYAICIEECSKYIDRFVETTQLENLKHLIYDTIPTHRENTPSFHALIKENPSITKILSKNLVAQAAFDRNYMSELITQHMPDTEQERKETLLNELQLIHTANLLPAFFTEEIFNIRRSINIIY